MDSNKELNEAKTLLLLIGQCVGVAIGTATSKGEERNPYAAINADVAKGARVCATALDDTLRYVLSSVAEAGLSPDIIRAFAKGVVDGIDVSKKVDEDVPKNVKTSIDISGILAKIMRKE